MRTYEGKIHVEVGPHERTALLLLDQPDARQAIAEALRRALIQSDPGVVTALAGAARATVHIESTEIRPETRPEEGARMVLDARLSVELG